MNADKRRLMAAKRRKKRKSKMETEKRIIAAPVKFRCKRDLTGLKKRLKKRKSSKNQIYPINLTWG